MPEVVVTATGYPEEVSKIAGTVQVITQDRIAHSNAKSVTELLAENSVGFMSQWTAGQTSINIRGGATEGQGRDFKSEVLILINSHRAGTANISKLSIADVERVEIVRGPASVVYGSQNMGGVINIILKTGRTAEPGTFIEGAGGSWNYVEGKVQNAGNTGTYDWYAGGNGARQGDYQVGGGQVELNTAYNRYGGTGAFGWQIDPNNRIDVTARSDGVYGTGFRGSSANIFANDNRYNDSIDFTWHGKTPSDRAHFMFQGYYVYDVDDLSNPSPLSNLNALASRTTIDENRRQLNIVGFRMQPRFNIIPSNELLVGVDWEQTSLSSTRFRAGGTAVTQLSPQDNNELNRFWGFYAEDTQQLFDDRVTVRGGVRQTFGTQGLLATPNAPTLIPGTVLYQATTYSAGATYQATDWLNMRFGASSGFRAPTATELGANFTVTPIGTTIFGNPGLQPETSQQLEVGSTFTWGAGRLDLALFQNVIHNRIQSVTLSSVGGVVVQQSQNSQGDLWMQGLEMQGEADVIRTLQAQRCAFLAMDRLRQRLLQLQHDRLRCSGAGLQHQPGDSRQPVRGQYRHALRSAGRRQDAVERAAHRHPARADVVQHRGGALAGVLSRPGAQRHRLPEERLLGLEHALRDRSVSRASSCSAWSTTSSTSTRARSSSPSTRIPAAPTWRRRTARAAIRCPVVNS